MNLRRSFFKEMKYKVISKKKNIWIFQSWSKENVGDYAIEYAQYEFIRKHFPTFKIIEVPYQKDHEAIKFLKKQKKNQINVLMFKGGGNFGGCKYTQPTQTGSSRKRILDNSGDWPVVFFPQSNRAFSSGIYDKKVEWSNKHKKIAFETFKEHAKRVTITARDLGSYESYKIDYSSNKIILTPDIVLTLNERKSDIKRNGILLCLRPSGDQESLIPKDVRKKLISKMNDKYSEVEVTDTTSKVKMTKKSKNIIIQSKLDQFRKANVVVTDRLHGLIFSIITGTPCVFFDQASEKCINFYNTWLKDFKGIHFIDIQQGLNYDDVLKAVNELEGVEVPFFDEGDKYKPLIDEINSKINQQK